MMWTNQLATQMNIKRSEMVLKDHKCSWLGLIHAQNKTITATLQNQSDLCMYTSTLSYWWITQNKHWIDIPTSLLTFSETVRFCMYFFPFKLYLLSPLYFFLFFCYTTLPWLYLLSVTSHSFSLLFFLYLYNSPIFKSHSHSQVQPHPIKH